ncbi:YhbY family RNA-binding protein, partial [Nanoarchaeota archaeon]
MKNNNKLPHYKAGGESIEPVVRIGKNGLTPAIIDEIKNQLRKRKIIKIKILKSALQQKTKKEFSDEIAEKTGSNLLKLIGSVIIL